MFLMWVINVLYGIIFGISQPCIISVLRFLKSPLSDCLTMSLLFLTLVYLRLLIKPPSYNTRMLLTLFASLFTYSSTLFFKSLGRISFIHTFEVEMYSAMTGFGVIPIKVVHNPSWTAFTFEDEEPPLAQWTGFSTLTVFFFRLWSCHLERFSAFSLQFTCTLVLTLGGLGILAWGVGHSFPSAVASSSAICSWFKVRKIGN